MVAFLCRLATDRYMFEYHILTVTGLNLFYDDPLIKYCPEVADAAAMAGPYGREIPEEWQDDRKTNHFCGGSGVQLQLSCVQDL